MGATGIEPMTSTVSRTVKPKPALCFSVLRSARLREPPQESGKSAPSAHPGHRVAFNAETLLAPRTARGGSSRSRWNQSSWGPRYWVVRPCVGASNSRFFLPRISADVCRNTFNCRAVRWVPRAKTTVTGTKRIPQNPSKAGGSDVVLSVGFGAFRLAF